MMAAITITMTTMMALQKSHTLASILVLSAFGLGVDLVAAAIVLAVSKRQRQECQYLYHQIHEQAAVGSTWLIIILS